MTTKGVGAESSVKAEAIVFLDYFLDFPHTRQGGFAGFAKFVIGSRGGARGSKIRRRYGAAPRQKTRPSTPAAESRGKQRGRLPGRSPPRGLLYIFPGAGTLRKSASPN